VRTRLRASYRIRSNAQSIEPRARALAIEQSIEMPIAAIDDEFVRCEIVGDVEAIEEVEPGIFQVCIGLAPETVGNDPGQLLNVLFGNSSLHEDVVLHDVDLPAELVSLFGGPRHGLPWLRQRVGAGVRALTCSALKPQGLSAAGLAYLAERLALGGIDYVKDDHGLADQVFAPFEERVEAIVRGVSRANHHTGGSSRYVPSLSGNLDAMRRQLAFAAALGVDTVMVAPMIVGWSNFHLLVRERPQIAFVAHPSMAGAARVAPPLLLGKLFRLLGADATIFPNHGGRFGYSAAICRSIAGEALANRGDLRPCVPVPAGGMSIARVREMLDFYGANVMLLIGGALLETRDRLVEATSAFVGEVHGYGCAARSAEA
jgi:ribulose-bisphosphate carboxylase large chain